jgi:hypothetical protein
MSRGGTIESNVRSFELFVTIYLSITSINYTKYLIIKKCKKKASKEVKKRNYYLIFNRCHCDVTRAAHVHG